MNTTTKHSVLVEGHKTSISLEPEFWQAFTTICREQGITVTRKIQRQQVQFRQKPGHGDK